MLSKSMKKSRKTPPIIPRVGRGDGRLADRPRLSDSLPSWERVDRPAMSCEGPHVVLAAWHPACALLLEDGRGGSPTSALAGADTTDFYGRGRDLWTSVEARKKRGEEVTREGPFTIYSSIFFFFSLTSFLDGESLVFNEVPSSSRKIHSSFTLSFFLLDSKIGR